VSTHYETLLTTLVDGVLTVTLNRPERLNAYNPAMQNDLLALFAAVNDDDAVRVIVITGAGRGFCAGADISGGGDSFKVWGNEREQAKGQRQSITLAIYDCKKPVIAAINGVAVGVGITMCLPMDIRLMSSTAKIGLIFNRRGMVMEAGSSWFLPRLVGMQQAQEWVASGEMFGPEEALKAGLVRSVHAPEDLLPAAQALARKFCTGTSAVTTALNRQLMWKMAGAQNPEDALKLDIECIKYMAASADIKEGVAAFVEKRPAQFPLKASKDMPPFYPWWETKAAE
jgi:enoyl-CoA hydratase/carnithine racemase